MSKQDDSRDIVLSEELLIELAMRELKGRRPPPPAAQNHQQRSFPRVKSKLQRELEGRGWTYRDLALSLGIPSAEAQAIARGGQRISADIAQKLGKTFATSADYWLREDE